MKKLALLILLSVAFMHVHGQNKVWKKRVYREISLGDTALKNDRDADSTLILAIKQEVLSGRITTYSPHYGDISTKMKMEALKYLFDHTDSTVVYDPAGGVEVWKVVKKTILPRDVYKYRIAEEWTFDPVSGIAISEIRSVAPVQDIYGDDGIYRGKIPIFWMNYKDLTLILTRQSRANTLFIRSYWNSNFDTGKTNLCSGSKITENTHRNAFQRIDIYQPEDTSLHYLRNIDPDTTLAELIVNKIKSGGIIGWNGKECSADQKLTDSELLQLITYKPDTLLYVEDIAVGNEDELVKVVYRDFNYQTIHTYKLAEHWYFDPLPGRTTVKIESVQLIQDLYNDRGILSETKPMFWVRYKDIQPILSRIEQYHPNNTFAMHIWNSFFLSDVKPTIVK